MVGEVNGPDRLFGRREGRVPQILVVDDDANIRRVIRDTLESEGLVVATASDAGEALGMVARIQPLVVILDVHLPDMPGEYVAATLNQRANGITQIVTISGDEAGVESARAMRAVAFLRKPFDLAELIQIVQRLIASPPSSVVP